MNTPSPCEIAIAASRIASVAPQVKTTWFLVLEFISSIVQGSVRWFFDIPFALLFLGLNFIGSDLFGVYNLFTLENF